MRPIDADLMKNNIIVRNPNSKMEPILKEWIDAQKTVDAIPVEWIIAFCADDIAEDKRETIEWMLKVWKQEQEAR